MNALWTVTKSLAYLAVLAILLLAGCGPREEKAKQLWLYEYRGLPFRCFTYVVIYEKRTGYIKFKVGTSLEGQETVIEHSGRYTIEN